MRGNKSFDPPYAAHLPRIKKAISVQFNIELGPGRLWRDCPCVEAIEVRVGAPGIGRVGMSLYDAIWNVYPSNLSMNLNTNYSSFICHPLFGWVAASNLISSLASRRGIYLIHESEFGFLICLNDFLIWSNPDWRKGKLLGMRLVYSRERMRL